MAEFSRLWDKISRLTTMPAPQKAVLQQIAWFSQMPEGAYPTVQTLATRTGYSIRTVQNAAHGLEDQGWIKVVERRNEHSQKTSNGYEIIHRTLVPVGAAPAGVGAAPAGKEEPLLKEDIRREEEYLPRSSCTYPTDDDGFIALAALAKRSA